MAVGIHLARAKLLSGTEAADLRVRQVKEVFETVKVLLLVGYLILAAGWMAFGLLDVILSH